MSVPQNIGCVSSLGPFQHIFRGVCISPALRRVWVYRQTPLSSGQNTVHLEPRFREAPGLSPAVVCAKRNVARPRDCHCLLVTLWYCRATAVMPAKLSIGRGVSPRAVSRCSQLPPCPAKLSNGRGVLPRAGKGNSPSRMLTHCHC